MRSLTPCTRCARHIDTATPCPFCAEPSPRAPRPVRIVSALTRATIFASVAACWTGHQGSAAPTTSAVETTTSTSVTGTLRREGGEPGAQVMVQLAKVDGSGPVQSQRADATGAFRFDNVPPGRYQLVAQWPARPNAPAPSRVIDVVSGTPVVVDITLPVATAPVDPHPIAAPYGAPPARRRVV